MVTPLVLGGMNPPEKLDEDEGRENDTYISCNAAGVEVDNTPTWPTFALSAVLAVSVLANIILAVIIFRHKST